MSGADDDCICLGETKKKRETELVDLCESDDEAMDTQAKRTKKQCETELVNLCDSDDEATDSQAKRRKVSTPPTSDVVSATEPDVAVPDMVEPATEAAVVAETLSDEAEVPKTLIQIQYADGRRSIHRRSSSPESSSSSESHCCDVEIEACVSVKKNRRLDLSSDDEVQAGAVGGKKILYDSEEEERMSPEQKAARRKARRLADAAYDLECAQDTAKRAEASRLAADTAAAVSARLEASLSLLPIRPTRADGRKRIKWRSESSDSDADAAI
jgi:hypothetical protein